MSGGSRVTMMTRGGGGRIAALILLLMLGGPLATLSTVDARQTDSPAGRIAFVRGGNVWAWSPNEEARQLFTDGNASDPRWSPDGGEVLYVQRGTSFSNLATYDFSSATAILLTDFEADAEHGSKEYVANSAWVLDPAWSANGVIVYVSDKESEDGALRLWLMPTWESAGGLAPTDETDAGDIEDASVDANATVVVYTVLALGGSQGGGTYVAIRDLLSGATFPLVEGPRGAFDPALSSDGQSIVVSIRDETGVTDLWMVDRATGSKTQLTEGQQAVAATWSPDAAWIAYLRPGDGGFEAWAMPVDRATRSAGEPVRLFHYGDLDATSGLSWTYSQIPLP